jgi:pyrroline-5-carboxylate reductase
VRIGFIGSGNMARAMALAIAEPAAFSDSGSGRAAEIAQLTGGTAASNADVAAAADVIFLCHKPKQLQEVAAQLDANGKTVVSALAATSVDQLRAAYPASNVVRIMPNTPVELGAGVVCVAAESAAPPEVTTLLERMGEVITLPEAEFALATAIGGCAPAFFALFAEKLVEAATRRGMDAELAGRVAGKTLLGTARLLEERAMDTVSVRRAVASPGGLTERALESFESDGLGDVVDRAVATVLGEELA